MTPTESSELFAAKFLGQANYLAMSYGGPVYLVGSMLTSPTPGDIDLRCLISREDAETWFGERPFLGGNEWSAGQFAIKREELKQSRRMTRRWRCVVGLRIDFQFQALPCGESAEPVQDDRPRLRIDRVPDWMLHAGRGDP